jgi:hypothetical protein
MPNSLLNRYLILTNITVADIMKIVEKELLWYQKSYFFKSG